jgi:flagellar hook-associated protein 1 FlgK
LQDFSGALQDLADDPASSAARQAVLGSAQSLADRFHALDDWLGGVGDEVNTALEGSVNEVNRLTTAIADLNGQIVLAAGVANEQPPNDLLDQRDSLIRELSEQLSVTTYRQDDGAINVMVGNGQALVVGNHATRLAMYRDEGTEAPLGIVLEAGANGRVPVTDQLTGGRIGGLLGFRERMLDPTVNELGRIALGVGQLVNGQHEQGMDLNGNLGQAMFSLPEPGWDAYPGVTGSLGLAWEDIGQATGADYRLEFDSGGWSIQRTDTNETLAMTGSGTVADPFMVDGLRIVVDPAPANGDAYLIQPTRNGAEGLELRLGDPALVASASPVLAAAAPGNAGSASITSVEVTDIGNPAFQDSPGSLTPPLMVRFTSAGSYDIYDNSDPNAPVLLESVSGYDPAAGAELFPTPGGLDYGYQARISGAAVAGDEFTVNYNTGGTGDNRNALAMANLFDDDLLSDGSESINDAYRRLVSDTGGATRQAELSASAQGRMLERALAERDAVSGVNLDEEAVNLVRYQQAYQAAAQVVAVANDLFDTLLQATRG